MDPNPYQAAEHHDEVPPTPVPILWSVAASGVVSILSGVSGVPSNVDAFLFWGAILLGIPAVSFIAGHGRRRERVASAFVGIAVAFAGIIAFFSICLFTGSAVGQGPYGPTSPVVAFFVFFGSTAAACGIVIFCHHRRGTYETPASDNDSS